MGPTVGGAAPGGDAIERGQRDVENTDTRPDRLGAACRITDTASPVGRATESFLRTEAIAAPVVRSNRGRRDNDPGPRDLDPGVRPAPALAGGLDPETCRGDRPLGTRRRGLAARRCKSGHRRGWLACPEPRRYGPEGADGPPEPRNPDVKPLPRYHRRRTGRPAGAAAPQGARPGDDPAPPELPGIASFRWYRESFQGFART